MYVYSNARWAAVAILVIVQLSLVGPNSLAAEPDPASVGSALARCRAIVSPELRLACFDNVSGEESRPATVVPGVPVTTTGGTQSKAIATRGSTPKIVREKPPRSTEPSEFPVAIVRANVDGLGRVLFFLDNKELWRQDTPELLSIGTKFPRKAEIKKGRLGSYTIRLEGQASRIPVSFVRTY